jgi:hypothetical protein
MVHTDTPKREDVEDTTVSIKYQFPLFHFILSKENVILLALVFQQRFPEIISIWSSMIVCEAPSLLYCRDALR